MRLLAARPNVVSKLSGLGTFLRANDPEHIGFVVRETLGLFGAERCLFGSNFPDREALDRLLRTHGRAPGCGPGRNARRRLRQHGEAGLPPLSKRGVRKSWRSRSESWTTATSSSNRAFSSSGAIAVAPGASTPTAFLILGGPWPVVVDTGYRHNQIMETLGMRGLQFHENMIENQLAKHGVRMGDVRYVLHTHLHIDHAGKDELFSMNTTVIINRRELEYSVSGLMHPQYPAPTSST
jgi:hypothetical protein